MDQITLPFGSSVRWSKLDGSLSVICILLVCVCRSGHDMCGTGKDTGFKDWDSTMSPAVHPLHLETCAMKEI